MLWWAGDVPPGLSSGGRSHCLCVKNMSGFLGRKQKAYCPRTGVFADLFRWADPVMPPLPCGLLLVSSDGVWFLPFLVSMTWEFCPKKPSAVQSYFRAPGNWTAETPNIHISLNGLETESNLKGIGRGNLTELPKILSIHSFSVDVDGKRINLIAPWAGYNWGESACLTNCGAEINSKHY